MNALFALPLSIAILYAWAGVCFFFYRFARAETEGRMRRFLEGHHSFFTERLIGESRRQTTPQAIREAGTRGWLAIGLPVINFGFGIDYPSLMVNSAVLFFGGLMFAWSWYGLRCFRILGLESSAKQTA